LILIVLRSRREQGPETGIEDIIGDSRPTSGLQAKTDRTSSECWVYQATRVGDSGDNIDRNTRGFARV